MSSRPITIFEGPDGGGKTTAAQAYAKQTRARYVHFGPFKHVKHIARLYVEAMLPALLGYQPVVMDRSWLSEIPYGRAFRKGKIRLTRSDQRMLERLAMRCGAVVVNCMPPWNNVLINFVGRRKDEMLDSASQLKHVYHLYQELMTDLPLVTYDYTRPEYLSKWDRIPFHPLGLNTAGNLNAQTVLVGDALAEPKEGDPLYQWPFASFNPQGCSQWLTNQLDKAGIGERSLCWANADQDLDRLLPLLNPKATIYALGKRAKTELYQLKIRALSFPHPQAWRRFHYDEPYPLIESLKEKKNGVTNK